MGQEGAFSHKDEDPRDSCPRVVFVHYGKFDTTRTGLEHLARFETAEHEVLVVDHGPLDGLEAALAGVHPRCRVIRNHANPGFASGCNLGAEAAFRDGATGVWFLNNDAEVDAPILSQLQALAAAYPRVALWGTHQVEQGTRIGADRQKAWYASALSPCPVALPPNCRQLEPRESLSGASIFLSREAWQRLGPWPEDCFLYYEDAGWCRRAHSLGLPIVLTDLAVTHPRGTTTGRTSPMTIFYGVRNQLHLHRQILPEARLERLGMACHLLQKRFFQGRWQWLRPTWQGILAAFRQQRGRDPRY